MRRALCILLAVALLSQSWAPPLWAQEAATPAAFEAQMRQARELLKAGDYDRAVEVLRGSIESARGETAHTREAYLLLIKSYVFLGNDFKFKPQGRMASSLNYKEAKSTIAECLSTPGLSHTQPEPADEYPPEMHALFAEVRSEIFGAFRVVGLDPAAAVVTLDADTLRAAAGETTMGEVDLPVGAHHVVVSHPGFDDLTDEIAISPNAILERSYTLQKRRGKAWYAAWIGGAALVVAGVVALVAGSGSSTDAAAQPLPGPPGPPAR